MGWQVTRYTGAFELKEAPVYWTDPLRGSFDVNVAEVIRSGTVFHVKIEENVVRPSGGGQAGDRGLLKVGDVEVEFMDTTKEGVNLFLVCNQEPISHGKATIVLDMRWRTAMMRNHTGEHIFVRAISDMIPNVSVGKIWIDGRHGTVEVLGKNLSEDIIFKAEKRVNDLIESGVNVKTKVVESEELDESVRAREGVTAKHEKLRIVAVEGFDESACSGIHVTNTSILWAFKIVDYTLEEDRVHVEFFTGERAVKHLMAVYNDALVRKNEYPFQMEQLGAVLDKSKITREDNDRLVERLTKALTEGASIEKIGNVCFQAEMLPGFDNSMMKTFVKARKMKGPTILLLASPGSRMHVMLRTNEMTNDASFYIEGAIANLGGRGGGKGEVFTCGFTNIEDSEGLFDKLKTHVREKISL